MFHNKHNDYEEFQSVRSGPTHYDDPEEDHNTVNNTASQRPDDASSLNYTHSTNDNFDPSLYDDFSRDETTPYENDQQYDDRKLDSQPNPDDERSSYQPTYSVNGDERSSYQPNHSVQEKEGSFILPSEYDEEMYDADEAMDTDSRHNVYGEPEGYDPNHQYSNDGRYRDDPYADDEDAEQDALHRTENYKPSLEQRKQKCCNTCYVPSCEFRGPCKFPHGCCYAIMGIMSAVGGLMMNVYVLQTCLFQRVQQINLVTGDIIPGSQRGYGFFSREADYGVKPDYQQCIWYPPAEYADMFDGWMKTGRFFAMLSAILAIACFVVMLMTCCFAFSRSMFEKWLFWMYIWAAIFVAFSFFIFGNEYCQENDCKVADGCGWAISAFMFHLLAANTVKSFPMANAPTSSPKRRGRNKKNNDEYEESEDEDEFDDLYYENEDDKYPPFHPDGPRGVTIDKDGLRTFDDGEDYYNDMGRLVDPYAKPKPRSEEEELEDISDHDLDQYASDNEEEDDDKYDENDPNQTRSREPQRDPYGNLIFDPDAIEETGNLGVGYEDEDDGYTFADDRTNPQGYGNKTVHDDDHYSYPAQEQNATSQYDNATVYDDYGNPVDRSVAEDQSVQTAPSHYVSKDRSVDAFSYNDFGSEYSGSVAASDNATERDGSRYQNQAANIGQEQHPSGPIRPKTIYEEEYDDEYGGPVFT